MKRRVFCLLLPGTLRGENVLTRAGCAELPLAAEKPRQKQKKARTAGLRRPHARAGLTEKERL